jgi:hypothetical protein
VLVSAQPRLGRRDEHADVAEWSSAPGRARQHEAGQLGTELGGIPPRQERPHAVADEEDRQARLLLPGALGEGMQVVDDRLPPLLPAEAAARAPRLPVAAVVGRINGIPVVGEALREARVAGRVLGHPVCELHDRLRGAFGEPPVDEHLGAVGCGQRERAALHGSSSVSGAFARTVCRLAG